MGSSAQPTPCPICKKHAARRPENPSHPFCSRRCKLVDLGAWFDESYRVPATGNFDPSEIPDLPPGNDDNNGFN